MSNSLSLTLIVPDIGPHLTNADQTGSLAQLAGRGSVTCRWSRRARDIALRPWQRGMLEVLGVRGEGLASAPIAMSPEPGACWLHAEPAHLVTGLDRLAYLPLDRAARLNAEERASLLETFTHHFDTGALRLVARDKDWFIQADASLRVTTSTPEAAAANELTASMPHGPDAPVLRRFLTEIQMVLHEHPVNENRTRRGVPAINSLWLWGAGVLPSAPPAVTLPTAFADEPFICGLYHWLGGSIAEPRATIEEILGNTGNALASIRVSDLRELDEQWLAPIARALSQGRLRRFDLILDEWLVQAEARQMWRFWRRPRPPSQWDALP